MSEIGKNLSEIDEKTITDEMQIKQCQDLTPYFGKSDHSVNKFYQTKVRICQKSSTNFHRNKI